MELDTYSISISEEEISDTNDNGTENDYYDPQEGGRRRPAVINWYLA